MPRGAPRSPPEKVGEAEKDTAWSPQTHLLHARKGRTTEDGVLSPRRMSPNEKTLKAGNTDVTLDVIHLKNMPNTGENYMCYS